MTKRCLVILITTPNPNLQQLNLPGAYIVLKPEYFSMASNPPTYHPGAGDQVPSEEAPPAYNEATGVLDFRQNGLNTQTRVGG